MLRYALKRLLATIPVMGVVALFVFSLLYLSPGDPAAVIAGDIATEEDIARIRAQLGLDQPYLVRFGSWLWALAHGDLGISIFTNLPVSKLIGQRVEPTLALTLCTLIVAVRPRGAARRARRGARRRLGRPHRDGVLGARLLGAGVRDRLRADLRCSRSSSNGCRCRATAASREGFWPFLRHMILPSLALGTRLHGADRAHHARDDARRALAGLHAHRHTPRASRPARC